MKDIAGTPVLISSPTPTPENNPEWYPPQGKLAEILRESFAGRQGQIISSEDINAALMTCDYASLVMNLLSGSSYNEAAEIAGLPVGDAMRRYQAFEATMRGKLRQKALIPTHQKVAKPSSTVKTEPISPPEDPEYTRHAENFVTAIKKSEEIKARKSNQSMFYLLVAVFAFKGLFTYSTDALVPDIASDGHRLGTVVGFRYVKNTWWGLSQQTFDTIRFSAEKRPQYFDSKQNQWVNVPESAFAQGREDDDSSAPDGNYQ